MKRRSDDIPFEESLNDDWSQDLNMVEVPLGRGPLWVLGLVIFFVGFLVFGRVIYLNWFKGSYYEARAEDNAAQSEISPAPRGIIYDRNGVALVQNQAVFDAVLDPHVFLSQPSLESSTFNAAQSILGISPATIWSLLDQNAAQDFSTPVILTQDLSQTELVNLQALGLSTIKIQSDFQRYYPNGPIFSSVLGYAGRVTQNDLASDPQLSSTDFIGKMGIEEYYDSTLRGTPGMNVQFTNSQGQVLGEKEQTQPTIGAPLDLTIDAGLQTELYDGIANELTVLGRQIGFGLMMNPQNGQVLAMVNLPGFDNNAFSNPASNTLEIESMLTSPEEPLFNRAVSGNYNPGSTVKPLDAVAALKEGIIQPSRIIFSQGYLMLPNPYNSSTPTKYLDWEYHGDMDLADAIAQSSDVYFYILMGGSPAYSTPLLNDPSDYGIQGLGIDKLFTWWQTFGFGKKTGIDLPAEASGFLPTPAWKQKVKGTPWLTGDTYNVAIGQGDLSVTPLQLLSYINGIATGGKIYRPYLNMSSTPVVNEDLTNLLPQIQDVQAGMAETVTSPKGTAYVMNDLPFSVCAKSGSAQVDNNAQENALIVAYAPCENPQVSILIFIANSKAGSLNATPIAKIVLDWYYQNRMNGSSTSDFEK
jgi:penicillin-binding protein 2